MHTTGTPPKTPAGLQQRSQEELQLIAHLERGLGRPLSEQEATWACSRRERWGNLTAEERRRQDLFYKRTIDQVAGKLGFDPAKIEVSDASPKFKLNDQEFDYAAAADMQTGKITVYRKHMVLSEASGSLAHEIMHQKFEAAVKSRSGCVRVLRRPWHAPRR